MSIKTYSKSIMALMQELILCHFEKENKSGVFGEKWVDPYDSIWLELATAVISVAEGLASIIMVLFVLYETRAYGNYRTVINQLLSYLYAGVRLETGPKKIILAPKCTSDRKYTFLLQFG